MISRPASDTQADTATRRLWQPVRNQYSTNVTMTDEHRRMGNKYTDTSEILEIDEECSARARPMLPPPDPTSTPYASDLSESGYQ